MATDSNDPTRAEEQWDARKLATLGVVTVIIVLLILYKISP